MNVVVFICETELNWNEVSWDVATVVCISRVCEARVNPLPVKVNLNGVGRQRRGAVCFVSQKQWGGQSRHCAALCYTARSRVRCRGQRDDCRAACEANTWVPSQSVTCNIHRAALRGADPGQTEGRLLIRSQTVCHVEGGAQLPLNGCR